MGKLQKVLSLSWFKTLYFNFRFFRFGEAIRFPVLVFNGVKLIKLDGHIRFDCPLQSGLVHFKKGGSVHLSGTMVFKGSARFGERSGIYIAPNATMTIGDNFIINGSAGINCNKGITFGNNCLISWDVNILDTDFHKIYQHQSVINPDEEIEIGDDVWIGFRTIIMKGTKIGNKIVIGSGSLLNKSYLQSNSIYAGNPAKLVKEDVEWTY